MPSFRTTRRVPFTPRQMFDLVADVERYPEFLPLCEALVVKQREPRRRQGQPGRRHERWATWRSARPSRARHARSRRSLRCRRRARQDRADPFRQLENRWQFRAAPGGCDVDFFIAYEFKSMMLQMLVGALFDRAFRRYTLRLRGARARDLRRGAPAPRARSAEARPRRWRGGSVRGRCRRSGIPDAGRRRPCAAPRCARGRPAWRRCRRPVRQRR